MAGPDSLVIMATYNEAGNLGSLVSRVVAYPEFDVVVIDDNSPDGTGAVAEELVRRFPGRVSVLHRSHKQGLGTALVLGYRHALTNGHDRVFQMDADLSHDPSLLPRMRRSLEVADVVIGSRYVAGGSVLNRSPWRRLLSRAASSYAGTLLGLSIRDPMGGYKGYRRSVLEALDLDRIRSRGYAIQAEMSFRCRQRGFAIVELPTVFTDRVHGRSKMTGAVVIEALLMPLVLLARRPFEAASSRPGEAGTPVAPGGPDKSLG
jgi:dolichol-phosphate mannosyltransferase